MLSDEERKERDRQKKKQDRKEAFKLIGILLVVFFVLILSSNENKMKKGTSFFESIPKGGGSNQGGNGENTSNAKDVVEEEQEEEIDSEESEERLEKVKEKITEPSRDISQNEMSENKNYARQKLKKEKNSGGIQIRITSFYLKKGTNSLVVEGIVGNYTDKVLQKPIVYASFYDDNEEVLDENKNILGSGGDLKSNMVVDFRVESIDDPVLRRFGKAVNVEITGIWKE